MMRRMGRPGLVGTMARTAVVAGTATAVVGRSTTTNKARRRRSRRRTPPSRRRSTPNSRSPRCSSRWLDAGTAGRSAAPAGARLLRRAPAAAPAT